MQNSVLLCISTLLESGNHYSKMFELKDSLGRQLFETISITLVSMRLFVWAPPLALLYETHMLTGVRRLPEDRAPRELHA